MIYRIILKCRHSLYDSGRKKSYRFDVPVISVGNITVGGTGKTPHSELLIRLLKEQYKIALISRGYKRNTKGFREVSVDDSFLSVGDEPLQIKRKFPDITVVVDASRKRAIDTLLALPDEKKPTLIILDDAFQHRRIIPALSIVLVDHSRPIFEDSLLPFGRLRDLPSQIKRADMVIVTKVPDYLEVGERGMWRDRLRLSNSQPLLFSKISYGQPTALFPESVDNRYLYSKTAVLFTGIANDFPLRNHLVGQYKLKSIIRFSDHHEFSSSEVRQIDYISKCNATSVVLTTEKDAQRLLQHKDLTENLKSKLFYIPIESEIIPDTTEIPRTIPEEMKEIGEKQFMEIVGKYIH